MQHTIKRLILITHVIYLRRGEILCSHFNYTFLVRFSLREYALLQKKLGSLELYQNPFPRKNRKLNEEFSLRTLPLSWIPHVLSCFKNWQNRLS